MHNLNDVMKNTRKYNFGDLLQIQDCSPQKHLGHERKRLKNCSRLKNEVSSQPNTICDPRWKLHPVYCLFLVLQDTSMITSVISMVQRLYNIVSMSFVDFNKSGVSL